MVYEYEITQELRDVIIDATMSSPLGVKYLRRYEIRCLGIAMLLVGLALLWENIPLRIIALISAAFMILLTFFGAKKIYRNSLKKLQQKQDSTQISGFRRYIFSENNVVIESSISKSEFQWEAFSSYMEYENYIFITLKDNRQLVVNKNKVSAVELENFLEFLNSKIKRG